MSSDAVNHTLTFLVAHLTEFGLFGERAPTIHGLTVSVVGDGAATPASSTYVTGTVVPITATAAPGWRFSGWSGDLTTPQMQTLRICLTNWQTMRLPSTTR